MPVYVTICHESGIVKGHIELVLLCTICNSVRVKLKLQNGDIDLDVTAAVL